jgi:hypothetical protein
MKTIELFKDSLSYSSKDVDKLLTLGVLFFFDAIISLLPSLTTALGYDLLTQILYFISNIIGIFIVLIAIGYLVSIIKGTIDGNVDIPLIRIIKNLSDGIKVFIISIAYYLIPAIVVLIVSYLIGVYNIISQIFVSFFYFGIEASIPSYSMVENIPNFVIISIIATILLIISTLFLVIAIARFADSGNIKDGLNFKLVFSDIVKISWGKYILLLLILFFILFFILFVGFIISIIPFLGMIILFLVILPFIVIFYGRSIGLVYKKSKIRNS